MKKTILTPLLISGLLGLQSKAQEVIRQIPCSNETMMQQADSVKNLLSQKGFIVVKEASMTMESGYEMPIIVPLSERTWYEFVFIGDISSKLNEMKMFDFEERQVAYQTNRKNDQDGNVISYTYIAQASEFHMIKISQVNKQKKKGLCGYVIMLKKVG